MEVFEFVCHAPSDYFRDRNAPYPTLPMKPEIGYIWTSMHAEVAPVPSRDEMYGLKPLQPEEKKGRGSRREKGTPSICCNKPKRGTISAKGQHLIRARCLQSHPCAHRSSRFSCRRGTWQDKRRRPCRCARGRQTAQGEGRTARNRPRQRQENDHPQRKTKSLIAFTCSTSSCSCVHIAFCSQKRLFFFCSSRWKHEKLTNECFRSWEAKEWAWMNVFVESFILKP